MSLVEIVGRVVSLNAHLFLLTVLVVPALAVAFLLRRKLSRCYSPRWSTERRDDDPLINSSGNPGLFQLRYNMRAIPLALVGAGWLFWCFRERAARDGICAVTVAALAISLPVTWHTMETYPWQFPEQDFLEAVKTGKDLGPTDSAANLVSNFRTMSDYVGAHVSRKNSILTDDAQSYGVMLVSGHPDLFFDRIDHGDKRWGRVLSNPYGKVEYMLVAGSSYDNIHACYPRTFAGTMPGIRIVYQNSDFKLLRVDRHPPKRLMAPTTSGKCLLSSG